MSSGVQSSDIILVREAVACRAANPEMCDLEQPDVNSFEDDFEDDCTASSLYFTTLRHAPFVDR